MNIRSRRIFRGNWKRWEAGVLERRESKEHQKLGIWRGVIDNSEQVNLGGGEHTNTRNK